MPIWFDQAWNSVAPHVPSIALALGILVGGWIVALILRAMTYAALKRTTVDDRIAEMLGVEVQGDRVERGVARFVYYVALAFVGVAFFDQLQIDAVTTPIVGALSGLSSAVPSVLKAVLIAFVGFLAASVVRKAVVAILDRTGLVRRIESWSGMSARSAEATDDEGEDGEPSTAQRIGTVAFWAILVLTAIPVLEALEIGVLASPLQNAVTVVSTYLPKVLGAAFLAVLGYFLGRGARAAIRALVDKSGVNRALARFGVAGVLGEHTAGSILGNLAMAFIVLHFAISAVGRLEIEEISGPLGTTLTEIYGFLPRVLVGAVLLALGFAVARVAGRFARGVLAAIGFNSLVAHIGLYEESEAAKAERARNRELLEKRLEGDAEASEDDSVDPLLEDSGGFDTPADIGGVVVSAIIVILFVRQALGTMGLDGLAAMLDSLIAYLPNLLVAATVLGAGMWAGGWAKQRIGELVGRSKDRLFQTLPAVAHVSLVAIAAMVALQQLGVGNQLIAIAFALVLGAVCLTLALAFGLGGREVAGEILAREYEKRAEEEGAEEGAAK